MLQPKRDIVFQPGSGGHFIAHILFSLVGATGKYLGQHVQNINEYSYDHASLQYYFTKESVHLQYKQLIDPENRYALSKIIDYMGEYKNKQSFDNNWDAIDNLNLVTQTLGDFASGRNDELDYNELPKLVRRLNMGQFLIHKNGEQYTIEQEIEDFGLTNLGYVYNQLHDILVQQYATEFGFHWDVAHIPYHLNCYKRTVTDLDYRYVAIVAGDSTLYTQALKQIKHYHRQLGAEPVRDDFFANLNPAYLASVSNAIAHENYMMDLDSIYCEAIPYRRLIIENSADAWRTYFATFGCEYLYEKNSKRIHLAVNNYHTRNVQFLSKWLSRKQIDALINPYK